jgi:FkbM family methyltransferase
VRWQIGSLVLKIPEPLRSLRNLPLLGNVIHYLSHRLLPADAYVCTRIESGPATGLWLYLNPRTGVQYLHGGGEQAVQQALVEILEPGMVFYDIGANIGFFSLLAARLVGATGKVFSFEPDPQNAIRLRQNIERNGFANVTVVESGVWWKSGPLRFVPANETSPDHGVGKFDSFGTGGIWIPCVALDDFVQSAPIPGAIKCDVEGAEIEVFHGGKMLLSNNHPVVVCETHSSNIDAHLKYDFAMLGYDTEILDGNHFVAKPQIVTHHE